VVTGPEQRVDVAADGDWLLYSQRTNDMAAWALRAHHLAGTSPDRTLSDGLPAGNHLRAAITGTRLVWHREFADQDTSWRYHYELWRADLAGGVPTERIAPMESQSPRIDGDLVCYESAGTVRVMSWSTGRNSLVSNGAFGCDISGRRVVWLANRGSDITLAYERPLAQDEP
jgi:hypothetical protein